MKYWKRLIDIRWSWTASLEKDLVIWRNWTGSLEKDSWKCGKEQGRSEAVAIRLALAKQRTRMAHSGSRLPNSFFTRADVEKKSVIWTCEAWEINWNRFPITEGMVQLPRGSARARKVAKQQIGVTFNSRPRDDVIFSHKSRNSFFFFSPRSFQFSIFSIS